MAKQAAFVRTILTPYNIAMLRHHRTLREFDAIGRVPKRPPTVPRNPLERIGPDAIQKASAVCGCLRLSCRHCGLAAFIVRINSTTAAPFTAHLA